MFTPDTGRSKVGGRFEMSQTLKIITLDPGPLCEVDKGSGRTYGLDVRIFSQNVKF